MTFKKPFLAFLFLIIPCVPSSLCFPKNQTTSQPKSIISFMGAPGAGKGTLAAKCVNELKYTSLSVGNLLREEIARGAALGKEVECIREGKFASDELVTGIVEVWLTENLANVDTLILDGFPRTAHQAELFFNLLHTQFNTISFRFIDLIVTDETVERRLANRLVCEKCQMPESQLSLQDPTKLICGTCGGNLIKREDDKAEVVHNRLKVYAGHKELLLDTQKKADIKIDCIDVESKTPQQVFNELKELLEAEKDLTTFSSNPAVNNA